MMITFKQYTPNIHPTCFVAPSADIIGDVKVYQEATIWYNAVLRGDIAKIVVGKKTNIQDGCVLHGDEDIDTIIGDGVIVGHNAILHGCTIENNCLIGMGATVLNDVYIGENCIVGAGALITSGKKIPPNSLVLGSPAKVIRTLTQEEIQGIAQSAEHYVTLGKAYLDSN